MLHSLVKWYVMFLKNLVVAVHTIPSTNTPNIIIYVNQVDFKVTMLYKVYISQYTFSIFLYRHHFRIIMYIFPHIMYNTQYSDPTIRLTVNKCDILMKYVDIFSYIINIHKVLPTLEAPISRITQY